MIQGSYIFALSGGKYQQYTSDQSSNFLKWVCKYSKADNQIAIHRDGNLMYYAYAHKITISEIYGICIVCGEVCLNVQELYEFLKETIEYQAKKGVLFRFDEKGQIRKNIESLSSEPAEIDSMSKDIKLFLDKKDTLWDSLPPEDFSIPQNSVLRLSFEEDGVIKITEAIRHYHNVYITLKNSSPSSFSQTITRLNSENKALKNANYSLNSDITKLKIKQRNTLWTSILSIIVIIMGAILYFKVINPSEVTKYQTGEFIYYGPLKDKKPNGEGVAFYPETDKYGRRYYIGHFDAGERQDSTAMLFYQNGDYYYGSMKGDNWVHGLFYNNTDNSHYIGDFINNTPYDGVWFYHEKAYELKEGKIKK